MAQSHTYSENYIINYPEGDQSLERINIVHKEDINDKLYTVKDEDTLTSIAYRYYGNPKLWFVIADVNDDIILNPLELTTGTDLIIPNLEKYNI